jgi:hypothetical protein
MMSRFKVNEEEEDDYVCMAAAGPTFFASKISKEIKKVVVLDQANVD